MDAHDPRFTEGATALTCRQEERLPQKTRAIKTSSFIIFHQHHVGELGPLVAGSDFPASRLGDS